MSAFERPPLGLDFGSTRVRLAHAERTRSGEIRMRAIATRDVPDDAITLHTIVEPELVAAIVEDLHREIGARERRCVLSMNAEVASMRWVRFPRMSSAERRQAARFEVERFAGWDIETVGSIVRIHPVRREENVYAVGVAREDALQARIACARRSGLRPVGVDHDGCALRRAFPHCDAVLDIGHRQATLHVFTPTGPLSLRVPGGGLEMTKAIAADLSIEAIAAENRKRLMGTAGAGENARDEFAASINAAVTKARDRVSVVRRIAAIGNGSRLAGLPATIAAASGASVEMPASDVLRGGSYPDDVVRAAAQDWTLAACLTTWSRG
jgi:Tfp pilus assembly PilM family ATPase